jgi:transketolase
MRNTFIDTLTNLAESDPNIMFLTGDLGFGVVENFERKFPKQFLNCGVAEQNMIGMAAGLASEGKRVFVYSIANFPTFRCLEQIRNDVCYHELPVTIVAIGSGFSYGSLGYTHQALEDISIMRSLPGLRILSPTDPNEVKECLDLIISDPKPTYLRLGKNGENNLTSEMGRHIEKLNFYNKNRKCLVITTGSISEECMTAVEKLNYVSENTFCFSTLTQLKPLTIKKEEIQNFEFVVTVEEHSVVGGLGSIINDFIISNNLKMNVLNIGSPDKIMHQIGSTHYLRSHYGLDSQSLFNKIKDFIKN